jgi:hypothetical protein
MVPLTLELERGMLYYICSNSLLAFLVARYTHLDIPSGKRLQKAMERSTIL